MNTESTAALVHTLITIGDDHLVLGQRLSEWCGHAPLLEEDLSMPNMSLDMLGQARHLYSCAGELEACGRSEDDIAFLRSAREYRNCLLVERPNTDFAHTMLRQLYFAAFMLPFWQGAQSSRHAALGAIAGKAAKEVAYHIRHAGEWVIRLGDGTQQSALRMRDAVAALHPYTAELFTVNSSLQLCIDNKFLVHPDSVRDACLKTIEQVFHAARLEIPDTPYPPTGGREGLHSEAFGHLLAELQYMQLSYPGLTW